MVSQHPRPMANLVVVSDPSNFAESDNQRSSPDHESNHGLRDASPSDTGADSPVSLATGSDVFNHPTAVSSPAAAPVPENSPVDWSEKAASFKNFVKERGVSMGKAMRRLSEKLEDLGLFQDGDEERSPVGDVSLQRNMRIPIMKGRVTLFSKGACPDSRAVRSLLRSKDLSFIEINIDIFPQRRREIEEKAGTSSVPLVFFNDVLLGGIEELHALNVTGELDQKILTILGKECPATAPETPVYGDNEPLTLKPDEYAESIRKLREAVQVKDRFYRMRLFTKCFLGQDVVEIIMREQNCDREKAIEYGRKVAAKRFFHHVLHENLFEDGHHVYRFLEHDPVITKCYNFNRYINDMEPLSATEVEVNLRKFSSAIIDAYVSDDGKHVDYRNISMSEEFRRYLKMTQDLHRVDLGLLSRQEKLAFFINLYNLMMMHAIIVLGHPTGWLDRRKLFGDFQYLIGGFSFSLSDIQNGVLRANQRALYQIMKPFGPNDKRLPLALSEPEPLIHFAITSACKSSPALKCYSPVDIDAELMAAARAFFLDGGLVTDMETKTVFIDKMIEWFSADFGNNEAEILRSLIKYLEPTTADNVLELLNGDQFKILYKFFDWNPNS